MQTWNSIWLGNRMQLYNPLAVSALVPATTRRFCSAKPITVTELKKLANERDREEKRSEELEFVKKTGNLRQIFHRQPDDGLYPAVKPLSEIEADDVEELVSSPVMGDTVEKLIATRAFVRENPKLVNALVRHLYDKNGNLIEKMYY